MVQKLPRFVQHGACWGVRSVMLHGSCSLMSKALSILLLISSLTLAPKAFAEERWRIYDRKGRFEGSVRKNDDGRSKLYDREGRHEKTFRDDNGKRLKIYDQKGRFEGTVRQDDHGDRMKVYDQKGRYQGYIEDGRVYDRDGTLEHRIVPDKNNKKK
jgi:hypothetical protein